MEDIFNKLRKFMDEQLKDFFEDDLFNFDIKTSLMKNAPVNKSYSISYRWSSDMDEPEIKVEGDLSEEEIEKILEAMHVPRVPAMKAARETLKLKGADSTKKEEYGAEIPFTDIINSSKGTDIVLEMPGIGEKDVKVEVKGKHVIIDAEGSHRKYHKEIDLDFEPTSDPKVQANNGIITITFKK